MKKITTTIACTLLLTNGLFAKNQSGIYATPSDFMSNKLTYETDCKATGTNTRLHLHDFFWNNKTIGIGIDSNGKKVTLKKNGVYGYKNCNNESFRFYNNSEYQIIDNGGVFTYKQQVLVQKGKAYVKEPNYYFSTSATSAILPLTFTNLVEAYQANPKFIELLEARFGSNNINASKLNELYKEAMTK